MNETNPREELEYTIGAMIGKRKPIPSVKELKEEYCAGMMFPMEVTVIARWYGDSDYDLAPNGTRELLAWLLIAIDEVKQLRAKLDASEPAE